MILAPPDRRNKFWDADEDDDLRRHVEEGVLTDAEIGLEMGRPEYGIVRRVVVLGLRRIGPEVPAREPATPTRCRPGSLAKMIAMNARIERGEKPHHKDDVKYDLKLELWTDGAGDRERRTGSYVRTKSTHLRGFRNSTTTRAC